jgi:hypothetical protein
MLLNRTQGRLRALIALGFGTGISLEEANALHSRQVGPEIKIGERIVVVPEFVLKELRRISNGGMLFGLNLDYMHKAILKATSDVLGSQRSYKALRRTFVRLCAEAGVPLDAVVENTGEQRYNVYRIYRYFCADGRKAIRKLGANR